MNNHSTTIGSAFIAAGFEPRDYKLGAAIQEFIKTGGTVEKAHEVVDAVAKRLSSEARGRIPSIDGQPETASSRQPIEDGEGQKAASHAGQFVDASPSSSHHGGGGQDISSGKGHMNDAAPVREPTRQQRDASLQSAKIAAVTIMDSLRIDGRPIGDWTVSEARKAGRIKSREGYILIEAARTVANAKGNELLRQIVKEGDMQKIIQRAAEVADAV